MIFRSTFPFISPFIDYIILEFRGVDVLEGKAGTRSSKISSDEVDDNNPLFKVHNNLVTRDRGDLI